MIGRTPLLTLSLCLALLGLWLAAPTDSPLFNELVLDRAEAVQLWRFASGHMLHTSLSHLAWNLPALALLGTAIEVESRARLLLGLIVGCAAVSAWFFWQDDFTRYAGASGLLNTLLVVALYSQRRNLSNKLAVTIGLIALIKVIIEMLTSTTLTTLNTPGPNSGAGETWPSATGAHAAGYAAGVVLILLWNGREALMRRARPTQSNG